MKPSEKIAEIYMKKVSESKYVWSDLEYAINKSKAIIEFLDYQYERRHELEIS